MFELTLNRGSPVSIHEQLKLQIRYAIFSGQLPGGEQLPSIRELTAKLEVNRNTVHRVYLELQAEGLLCSRQGRGMYVRERSGRQAPSPRMQLNRVYDLAARLFHEGLEIGVHPTLLAQIAGHRAAEFDRGHPSVAFIECTSHASDEVAERIAASWGVEVMPLELERIVRNPALLPPHVKYLITSFFHQAEIEALARARDFSPFIITYDLEPASKAAISALPRDQRACFICRDKNSVDILRRQVEASRLGPVEAGCEECPEAAADLIEAAEVVIFSEAALPFVTQHVGDQHALLQADFEINEHSLQAVREQILPF